MTLYSEREPSFNFDQASPSDGYITLKITGDPAQYDVGKGDAAEAHALANGFVNKNVLFMAKFTTGVIACNIITLDDNTSEAFTFSPKRFTFCNH